MSFRMPLSACLFWAALTRLSLPVSIAAQPAIIDVGPNQSLVATFTAAPNDADMVWLFDNTNLVTSGTPTITGQLFNDGSLLGTSTQTESAILTMIFESPSSRFTSFAEGLFPTQVDMSSLNQGTTTACMVVTVTGGSIGLSLGEVVFYDALSISSISFQPLSDFTVTNMSIAGAPTPATLSIPAGGVVSAASYNAGAGLAPGSIASVFGTFNQICPANGETIPLPSSLSGLSMQFGSGAKAPLFYASAGQVNLQIPWELASQTETTLAATLDGQSGAGQTFSIAPFSPGIFSINSQGTGQGAILDTSYHLVDSSNPATPGTTYILIYCTGLGQVGNQPATGSPALSSPLSKTVTTPTVTVGGVSATVLFSGLAPGYVGLYQVNAQVPAGAPSGPSVPVIVSMPGVDSNTVTIAVQ
jgi:uncharacterized protein (TIGR03437 family)